MKRALIVEDEEMIVVLLEDVLEVRGIPYAYTSGADRRDEGLAGEPYLMKPCSFEALTAMIRQLDPGDTGPS